MTRASHSTRAERINTALALLRRHDSRAAAAAELMQTYGMSRRQAYRYLQQAQAQGQPVAIPARKIAFTVKLPVDLIHALRTRAAVSEQSLSQLVTQALEGFLRKGRKRGQ